MEWNAGWETVAALHWKCATHDIYAQEFAQIRGAFYDVLVTTANVDFPALENAGYWFTAMVEASSTSPFHTMVVYIRSPSLLRPFGAFG
ncbi:hypothetical protein [Schauerella aestuarii]|uniref:hypothetical protein n=1 Tax=Schauerella aestuarii TaxID=2511204 RepID=UPI00136CDCB4|nr:hypothetical protein [Achromobacter aestuarii]MYZ43677.1 hypothetical protein [Achromobacter aestuarii]